MSFNNFKRDAALGKVAELEMIRLFSGCGFKTTPVSVDKRKFWDLESTCPRNWLLPNNIFTTEVKYDIMYKRTGNLAIEIWNSKKDQPSGIKSTQSHLWAHHLSDSIWICRSSDLLLFVNNIPPKRIVESAGDGNATIMLYAGEDILHSVFHEVSKMTKKDFVKKIKELCVKQ